MSKENIFLSKIIKEQHKQLRQEPLNNQLINACYDGNKDKVIKLLEAGANIEAQDKQGLTPLQIATDEDYSDISLLLIERGAVLNRIDDDGYTILHDSVRLGNLEVTKAILSIDNSFINVQNNENGQTALHIAAANDNLQIIKLLIKYGADINVNDYGDARGYNGKKDCGDTPFDLIISANTHQFIIDKYIEHQDEKVYIGGAQSVID